MKKTIKLLLASVLTFAATFAQAQTAEEIVNKYIEVTGGAAKWAELKSVKMTAKGKQGGMEFPITSLQKAPNLMKQSVSFQGKEITMSAFDGKETWKTNFMTMKAEKGEAEDSENAAKSMDFPDPFLDYKAKGYSIALEGEEKVEGTDCYKIKLTKKPIKVDGKEEEDFSFYFFDKENGVVIMNRSVMKKGPGKDQAIETLMSDYQEVNGLFFPFTVSQKMNGQVVFSMAMEKLEMNVAIDNKEFAFPID
ncbi:outer membrane lipoprotein-sorting protein [Lacihabitans soyangensis]|uniref:Outer membrane lipoprotein-sorting protein n=1 Tax=Lacihabitans soyangensis TaxID=869394 RepID=A0AAE3H2R6_9BACT|nr:outer membrane lipoprotein-sorting protein [Lacihabitans soyangensis]MCP9763235.1 outer membrane lipoprotein-sorting protein [Lacihabitans soyangensis]